MKLEEKEAISSTELESDYHMMKREQSASDCSSSSGSDSRRQAKIPRGVANPSVGLFESSTGSGDWLKKLDNLPKLKTPTKDVVKVLEFQFLFKILMKAEGLQEGVQRGYLLWAVSGTTKSVKWPGVWGRKEWAGEGKKEREEREKERKRKVKSKSWERLVVHRKGKPTK